MRLRPHIPCPLVYMRKNGKGITKYPLTQTLSNPFIQAITNMPPGRKLSSPFLTAMGGDKDLLSPMGGDQVNDFAGCFVNALMLFNVGVNDNAVHLSGQ